MASDADAMPVLLDLMRHAGYHDRAECLRLVDEAETHLPRRQHKSKPDLDIARAAARDGNWVAVHSAAWGATCGLTWAFPPDPLVCPPVPHETPFPREAVTCGCGATPRVGARFCHGCGQPT